MASELKIIISASDKASGVIKSVGTAVSNLGSAAASVGKVALVGLAAGAAVAAAGVAALAGAAAGLAIAAAPMANVQAAFEAMTGAFVDGSNAMLDAMREASAGMIANTELMRLWNTAAQLVGEQFANQLPAALEAVGKAAASTGQDFDFLLNSLVTGIGRLSPMILDNLGITVDLVRAYEDWAAANDTTVAAMSKAQKQTALMNQVLEKLGDNLGDLPALLGTANQKWVAFQATMKNVAFTIGAALLPLLSNLLDFIGPKMEAVISKAIPVIQSLALGFDIFFDKLARGVPIMAALPGLLRRLLPDDIQEQVIDALPKIVAFFEGVGEAIGDFISTIDFEAAGQLIVALMRDIANIDWQGIRDDAETALADLGKSFDNFGDALKDFSEIPEVASFIQRIGAALKSISADAPTVLEDLGRGLKSFADAVSDSAEAPEGLRKIGEGIAGLVGVLAGEAISAGIEAISGLFKQLAATDFESLGQSLGLFTGQFINFVDALALLAIGETDEGITKLNAASEAVRALIDAGDLGTFAQNLALVGDAIGELARGAFDFSGLSEGLGTALTEAAAGAATGAAAFVAVGATIASNLITGFSGAAIGFATAVVLAISNALIASTFGIASFTGAGATALANIIGGFAAGATFITAVVEAVTSAVADALDAAGDAFSVGETLAQGVADGIESIAGAIIAALVKAVVDAIEAAKAAAGISSPSKVMMEQGKNLMQGLASGIVGNSNMPAAAMATATGATIGAVSSPGSLGGGQTIIINHNPGMTFRDERQFESAMIPIIERILANRDAT